MSEKSQQPLCLLKFYINFVSDRTFCPKNEIADRKRRVTAEAKTPKRDFIQ